MAQTKAKVDSAGFEKLKQRMKELSGEDLVDNATARKVGKAIVNEMKNLIGKGISPIRGSGIPRRLRGYKKSYVRQIRRGGGKFRSKKVRPVNLRLTGDFLGDLKFKIKPGKLGLKTVPGYSTRSSRLKEEGHRDGANSQRKRPTIPEESKGESFAARIEEKVFKIYDRRVNQLTKKPL